MDTKTDVMLALNMHVLTRPIVAVVNVKEKFDEEGNLTDLDTKKQLGLLKDALLVAVDRKNAYVTASRE